MVIGSKFPAPVTVINCCKQMKNDWETQWLPPVTLGIIRMTSLWLDHKKKNLFLDIITEAVSASRLFAMGSGGKQEKECRVNVMQRYSTHKYLIRGQPQLVSSAETAQDTRQGWGLGCQCLDLPFIHSFFFPNNSFNPLNHQTLLLTRVFPPQLL